MIGYMQKQVDRDHYVFSKYLWLGRFDSYWYQIKEILDTNPASVLEIGSGDEVVKDYVKKHHGAVYRSCDIAEDLRPDIVGSILALPVAERSYDTTCAFEVLEHLPFEDFEKGLQELARVSKKHVLISLPHFGTMIKWSLKIPFFKEMRFAYKLPFAKKHVWDGEHYWEIGKTGYSLQRIKDSIQKHLVLKRDYIPFENSYHHFFICEKKS